MDDKTRAREIREDLLKVGRVSLGKTAGEEKFNLNSMGSCLGMGPWHIWEIKSSSKGMKSRVCVNEGVGRLGTRVLSSFLTNTHIYIHTHSLILF